MSFRDGPLGELRPPKGVLPVLAALCALGAAMALYAADLRSGERGTTAVVRRSGLSVMGRLGEAISAPVHWSNALGETIGDYISAARQNRDLKAQLQQDRLLRDENARLRDENARYRALLGVATDPPMPMVFGRTVLDARGPFANTRIANVGAARGVTEGNPVLSDHGLIGRVIGVAPNASRIMLLTDSDSRTPVLIARTGGRAILAGDGGPNPRMDYLRTHDALRAGDRILTSGEGGILPRGLPVGVAVRSNDGGWRVALDSDEGPIDFVRVLLFKDFSQVIGPNALPPDHMPGLETAAPEPAAPASASPKPPVTAAPSNTVSAPPPRKTAPSTP